MAEEANGEVLDSWEEFEDNGDLDKKLEEMKLKDSKKANNKPTKTLEQREAEYAEARKRILGSTSSTEVKEETIITNNSPAHPSPCWLSSEYSAELNPTTGTGTVVSCPIQGLACSPNKLLQCGPV
uniref:SUZ domain-containing protein n=1 Tax=Magallana gigas TaxID=29159 RepID=K1Q4I6_MAGGI